MSFFKNITLFCHLFLHIKKLTYIDYFLTSKNLQYCKHTWENSLTSIFEKMTGLVVIAMISLTGKKENTHAHTHVHTHVHTHTRAYTHTQGVFPPSQHVGRCREMMPFLLQRDWSWPLTVPTFSSVLKLPFGPPFKFQKKKKKRVSCIRRRKTVPLLRWLRAGWGLGCPRLVSAGRGRTRRSQWGGEVSPLATVPARNRAARRAFLDSDSHGGGVDRLIKEKMREGTASWPREFSLSPSSDSCP